MGPFIFLCGRWAYKALPRYPSGVCTLAVLVPAAYTTNNEAYPLSNPGFSFHSVHKRDLFSAGDMVWSLLPGTGWGLMVLNRLNNFSAIVDEMAFELSSAIHEVSGELQQLRRLALQEKIALDYLLAAQGGFCKFIGTECCTWVDDSSDPIEGHLKKVGILRATAANIATDGWNPFKGLGTVGVAIHNWLAGIGSYLVWLAVCALLIYLAYRVSCCAIHKATRSRSANIQDSRFYTLPRNRGSMKDVYGLFRRTLVPPNDREDTTT